MRSLEQYVQEKYAVEYIQKRRRVEIFHYRCMKIFMLKKGAQKKSLVPIAGYLLEEVAAAVRVLVVVRSY